MATAPVKSQPLHYFSLPQLKWGNSSNHHRFRRRESPTSTADNPPPQTTVLDGGAGSDEHERELVVEEEEEEIVETASLWNLRPRRSTETVTLKKVESGNGNHVMLQRSQRLRDNNGDGYGVGSGKKGKRKLWISLSREEIEEDVYSMTGSRPARRPKKRSKTIQKQLDNAFPGLYLVGLTADSFRVNDTTK